MGLSSHSGSRDRSDPMTSNVCYDEKCIMSSQVRDGERGSDIYDRRVVIVVNVHLVQRVTCYKNKS